MASSRPVIDALSRLRRAARSRLARLSEARLGQDGWRGLIEATSTGHVVHLLDSSNPKRWQPLELKPGRALLVCGDVSDDRDVHVAVGLCAQGRRQGDAVTATVRFLDKNNLPLEPPYSGCRVSDLCPAYLMLPVQVSPEDLVPPQTIRPPEGARRIEVRLRRSERASSVTVAAAPMIAQPGAARELPANVASPRGWRQPAPIGVRAGQVLMWSSELVDAAGASPKAAVLEIRLYDNAGRASKVRIDDLSSSSRYLNYSYVASGGPHDAGWHFRAFTVPAGVASLQALLHNHLGSEKLAIVQFDLRVLQLDDVPRMLASWPPSAAWIEPAAKLAQADGALSMQERLANELLDITSASPESVKRWLAIRAELNELEPDWYPKLAVRSTPASTGHLTVCHLHKTAYPFENTGGAIRCLNTLRSQLAEGLDPYIITPPGYPAYDGVNDGRVKPHEQVDGCDHYRIGANTAGIRTLSPPARVQIGAVQAAAIVARRGARLVHAASGVRGYELALQAFALREVFDIPVIYEVRSFHEHTWAPAGPRVFDLERTQMRIRKENRCMALADHVVTISESMRRILIERGVSEDKIDVIPNGIDADDFREAPSPARVAALEGAQLVVGYVSNMSKREGHRHLIEAVALLRQGGIDCRCLFVGGGPERKALDELVGELGLTEVVHFAGEVDHRDIKAYYMAIDVFVIPRIPDYAADWVTPLKPYEAMALGRPLIVTDLPALREVIGDGERGLIAQPADATTLADAIRRYANDPALREQTSQRARQWVFEHRTWKANAQRYHEIYQKVIARYGEGRRTMRSPNASAG